jgi:hypothetical protein
MMRRRRDLWLLDPSQWWRWRHWRLWRGEGFDSHDSQPPVAKSHKSPNRQIR